MGETGKLSHPHCFDLIEADHKRRYYASVPTLATVRFTALLIHSVSTASELLLTAVGDTTHPLGSQDSLTPYSLDLLTPAI